MIVDSLFHRGILAVSDTPILTRLYWSCPNTVYTALLFEVIHDARYPLSTSRIADGMLGWTVRRDNGCPFWVYKHKILHHLYIASLHRALLPSRVKEVLATPIRRTTPRPVFGKSSTLRSASAKRDNVVLVAKDGLGFAPRSCMKTWAKEWENRHSMTLFASHKGGCKITHTPPASPGSNTDMHQSVARWDSLCDIDADLTHLRQMGLGLVRAWYGLFSGKGSPFRGMPRDIQRDILWDLAVDSIYSLFTISPLYTWCPRHHVMVHSIICEFWSRECSSICDSDTVRLRGGVRRCTLFSVMRDILCMNRVPNMTTPIDMGSESFSVRSVIDQYAHC